MPGNASAALFHPKSRRNGLLYGLTVAVTTRDSHPLPYSPVACPCSGDKCQLKNIAPSIVGAGFPRPIAWIIDLGGENPPLRQIAWAQLIIKDHQLKSKAL